MSFLLYQQYDQMDCGPTCLRMIARHYGRPFTLQTLRDRSGISREGVSLLGISEAAESIGFRTMGVRVSFQQLLQQVTLPCVVHWDQNHFVVLYRIKKKWFGAGRPAYTLYVADPGRGLLTLSEAEFLEGWVGSAQVRDPVGIALLLEPTPALYEAGEEPVSLRADFGRLYGYLWQYRGLLVQLVLGMLVGSGLQLILPFLMQSVVDIGINTQNLTFIHLVLLAQLMIFTGRTAIEFVRSRILLHVNARINLQLLSDFFVKLMKLPIAFFDAKQMGDIMQRVNDHQRIEQFLTGQTLSTLFSLFNLVVFGVVLCLYHPPIFVVFAVGSALYLLWVKLFLGQLRKMDYRRFEVLARSQSALVQLIQGMQEIKHNNCERSKRWEWEQLQIRQFHVDLKSLSLSQYQQAGALFLNEGKNILITILAAQAVLEGHLTLGAMLSVQYIIGQLNSPIEQLIQFILSWQGAKISLERLNEVHQLPDEEPEGKPLATALPARPAITVRDLVYRYPDAGNEPVLRNLSLHIPHGRVTAIVGASGSGKTTLLKLLLKAYDPAGGEIVLGDDGGGLRLSQVSHQYWRSRCGVVMQEGFIFSDTILRNIAVGDERPDPARVDRALQAANLREFVDGLPLGLQTKIGAEGNGVSQGQRQRILIARAVYKDPAFLFFDEATNALDANNERVILKHLDQFFRGRTVVVVAHRLSTVRNADQIVVMDRGTITERGTHAELTALRGNYYHLVKNQLELGN